MHFFPISADILKNLFPKRGKGVEPMRKSSGQSLSEKIIFALTYTLTDVVAICLVINVIKNNPDSASAAISAVC